MGKYFGTDGFRGEAGITLTADHAYKVGRFLGWYYNALRERNGDTDPARIVIGKDTRRSSYMFEYSLVASLTASGADAYLLHVTTTPSVAYIARVDDFDCGIMISASHNPYYDNGIKLIDCYGEKMPEETLLLVEDYIDGKLHVFDKDWPELPFARREHIGCTVDYVAGRNRYMGYLISLGIYSFKGVKVGLDCANGSSWNIAKSVFDALGADTYVINNKPNGLNINNNAGSTHIEGLQKFVVEKGLNVGFAFDGDADRCLCVDEKGNVITGDHTLNSVIKNGAIDLSSVEITEDEIKNFEQIYIVACGSAWHVGMAAQYVLEDIADIPVRVELASEFRYRKMPLNQKALVIVVSQSGETADTLAALRLAKEKGITTMAIVNVVGSSIAREADKVFYTLAGPEISVATTKAYSAQLAAMYCLAVQFAKVKGKITDEQYSYYISELLTLPEKMQKALEDKERIQWFAAKYANAHDVFFVGRGVDYAVCLEGSLKLKEISYIHSEAYAAGELKHGTISLIEQGTLVIGVLTQSELYEKTISNMLECKSRGAYLMGLTTYGKYEIEDQVNFTVYVPKVDEHFIGSLAVIPLQLLGYYVSVAKGLDVDMPKLQKKQKRQKQSPF